MRFLQITRHFVAPVLIFQRGIGYHAFILKLHVEFKIRETHLEYFEC